MTRWPSFMLELFTNQKVLSKMLTTSCANTHHDVTTFEVDEIV